MGIKENSQFRGIGNKNFGFGIIFEDPDAVQKEKDVVAKKIKTINKMISSRGKQSEVIKMPEIKKSIWLALGLFRIQLPFKV